jgi:hypothetical protein
LIVLYKHGHHGHFYKPFFVSISIYFTTYFIFSHILCIVLIDFRLPTFLTMGYTTEFGGFFTITPPLEGAPAALLQGLCNTRRMARDADSKYGVEGEYYVEEEDKEDGAKILDNNRPPRTQPALNCDWELSEDGAQLQWSGSEKFYGYTEWLRYFITRVFPEGTVLNGEVSFAGEDEQDKGVIQLVNNRISVTRSWQQQLVKQTFSREQCKSFQPQKFEAEYCEEYCEEFEAEYARTNSSLIACRDELFQSALPLIITSLQHYCDHHDLALALPLPVDYYISFIVDVAAEHHRLGTLPERALWITSKNGDVTQAVYFSVLLNPNLSAGEVKTVLSAYDKFFGLTGGRQPEVSKFRKYWGPGGPSSKLARCPWLSSMYTANWTYLWIEF